MHTTSLLLTVLTALAAARPDHPTKVLTARQSVVTPVPCQAINPPPTAAETEERFNTFADEFLIRKNLTAAFEYVSSTYIASAALRCVLQVHPTKLTRLYQNNNPFAEDGPNAALDFLGPVWPSTEITVLRTTYIDPQGFLNYNASGIGTIVDRFRWEAGCIVEHWDVGEIFPGDAPADKCKLPDQQHSSCSCWNAT